LVVILLARVIVTGERELFVEALVLLAAIGAFEWLMLRRVTRVIQAQRQVSFAMRLLNVFVESLLPTAALILLSARGMLGPYRALVAPAVLLYLFFIVLSTLRLSPKLSVFTGVFSAAGYAAATGYTYWRYPAPEPGAEVYPLAIYVTYALMILLGGGIAGGVAGQIRRHVVAALREAELRNQVRQMEHDLEIARSIQQGLLPASPPEIAGFQLAGWNRPADQTGGDYFDWQQLPNGRVAICLADVTGHGIGPALIMAACRAYARVGFLGSDNVPEVMGHLNRLLCKDLPQERFVTLVAALLDPARATLQIVSAGHGPILHYRHGADEFLECPAQGIPLGLISGIPYGPAQEVSLEPGDFLVLLTDGFHEWENTSGEEFGVSRVKESLRRSADSSPEAMIEGLYAAVTQFGAGTRQADDLTVVVLKRSG
jgi:serine phosphatase RsbU (regulator of sigma subunit)